MCLLVQGGLPLTSSKKALTEFADFGDTIFASHCKAFNLSLTIIYMRLLVERH